MSEDALKDKTGRLDHNAFKSCLRALGYDLPVVKEPETEFEEILNIVDSNRLVIFFFDFFICVSEILNEIPF